MIMYFSVVGLESNLANLTRQFVERARNQANYLDDACDHMDDDLDYNG